MKKTEIGRIILAEKNAELAEAIRHVFDKELGFQLVGAADTAEALLQAMDEQQADIVLLSHETFESHLFEVIERIRQSCRASKILVMSMFNDSRLAVRVLAAGASGYLLKDRIFEELGVALQTISLDLSYLSPGVAGVAKLPAQDPVEAVSDREAVPASSSLPLKRGRILILDDEESIRKIMSNTLSAAGYQVEAVASAKEALVKLDTYWPDLIFTDLVLPVSSGIEVIRRIRERDESLPIVVITGFPDSTLMQQALAYSPLTVLGKPIDCEKLRKTVRVIFQETVGLSNRVVEG